MIRLIEFQLNESATQLHEDLDKYLNEGWLIIGHCSFEVEDHAGEFIVGRTPWERYTLYKALEKQATVATAELELATIISAQRGKTKNNQRPMWRCQTDSGEMVNIFLNKDEPEKDSYHLFKQANWGTFLDGIALYDTMPTDIQIAMKKNGLWWEIAIVRPRHQSDIPDWAKQSYTFDEIVTEDDDGGES